MMKIILKKKINKGCCWTQQKQVTLFFAQWDHLWILEGHDSIVFYEKE